MKKILTLFLCVALSLTLISCSAGTSGTSDSDASNTSTDANASTSGETIKFKMANQHPLEHMATVADQAAIDEIKANSNGEIDIQLYPASQLGDYIQTYEEVMRGTIDIAHITIPDKFDSRINITVCPFMATTYEELEKVYGSGSYLNSIIGDIQKESNVKLLGIFTEGLIGVGTKSAVENITTPNADKSSKIRVPSYEPIKLAVERMGFSTSTIPYNDTFTSIQTGIVDGWMGGPPSLNYLTFRDVIEHYYQYNIVTEVTEVVMNLDTFSSLSDNNQKIIADSFDKQCKASITSVQEEDEKYMDLMKKEGIEVITFTPEEINAIAKDIRENVWPETYDLFPKEMLDGVLADLEK